MEQARRQSPLTTGESKLVTETFGFVLKGHTMIALYFCENMESGLFHQRRKRELYTTIILLSNSYLAVSFTMVKDMTVFLNKSRILMNTNVQTKPFSPLFVVMFRI